MPAASDDASGGADSAAREGLEQRFAERLLDDESLRGDLTDDEFQPVQDWALEQVHICVTTVADPSSPDADATLCALLECLGSVLRGVNDTLGHRFDLDPDAFTAGLAGLGEALRPPLYPTPEVAEATQDALRQALPALSAHQADDDSRPLVDELLGVLRGTGARTEAS